MIWAVISKVMTKYSSSFFFKYIFQNILRTTMPMHNSINVEEIWKSHF